MSLIALMATSVSAYAVSRSFFASGTIAMARPSSSIPVISGIRWSVAMRATGRSFNASSDNSSSASAPEVTHTTRYCVPYRERRSRVMAMETVGSSSTVTIVGFAMRSPNVGGRQPPWSERSGPPLSTRGGAEHPPGGPAQPCPTRHAASDGRQCAPSWQQSLVTLWPLAGSAAPDASSCAVVLSPSALGNGTSAHGCVRSSPLRLAPHRDVLLALGGERPAVHLLRLGPHVGDAVPHPEDQAERPGHRRPGHVADDDRKIDLADLRS